MALTRLGILWAGQTNRRAVAVPKARTTTITTAAIALRRRCGRRLWPDARRRQPRTDVTPVSGRPDMSRAYRRRPTGLRRPQRGGMPRGPLSAGPRETAARRRAGLRRAGRG